MREAAIDPDVKSIKLNVYRLAKNSQIMNALLSAVSNGKEVVVVFELQARFDEEITCIGQKECVSKVRALFLVFPD